MQKGQAQIMPMLVITGMGAGVIILLFVRENVDNFGWSLNKSLKKRAVSCGKHTILTPGGMSSPAQYNENNE